MTVIIRPFRVALRFAVELPMRSGSLGLLAILNNAWSWTLLFCGMTRRWRKLSNVGRTGILAIGTVLALLVASKPVTAEIYKIGRLDKLSVRIVDLQPADGSFREWSGLSGEYSVDAEGVMQIPFVGEVMAAGRSTGQLATEISLTLQKKLGLAEAPATSVELAEYRPITVAGDVQSPGKYAFEPHITVLAAVSLAGGPRRVAISEQRIEQDLVNARGAYELLTADHRRLLVRKIRLQAELSNSAKLTLPSEEVNPETEAIRQLEEELLRSRQQDYVSRRASLVTGKRLFEDEASTLSKSLEAQTGRMNLIKSELARTRKLADQRLVASGAIVSLELIASDTQTKLLEITTAIVRAKQNIDKTSSEIDQLDYRRKLELVEELEKVDNLLLDNAIKEKAASRLIAATTTLGGLDALPSIVRKPKLEYTIVRELGPSDVDVSATENSRLQPGDILKVVLVEQGKLE